MSSKIHLQIMGAALLAATSASAQTPEGCIPATPRVLIQTLKTQPDLLKPFAHDPTRIHDARAVREFVNDLVGELRRLKRDGRFECGYTTCDNNP